MLRGCPVCVTCYSNSFPFFIFKLCIMIVHTLNICIYYFVHISQIFFHFWVLNLDIFPFKMLRWCLVCGSVTPAVFIPLYSFIFKLYIMHCSNIEHLDPIFCAHLIIYLGVFNLYYDVYTTFGVLTLCNLCVICNSNRFHSFIFELCIMIVHTLKMSTANAGPEQSLDLFYCFTQHSSLFHYVGLNHFYHCFTRFTLAT